MEQQDRAQVIGAGGRPVVMATAYDPEDDRQRVAQLQGGMAKAAPSPVESATLDLIAARETLAVRIGRLEDRLATVLPQNPEETANTPGDTIPERGSSVITRCINEEARTLLRLADRIERLTDRLEV